MIIPNITETVIKLHYIIIVLFFIFSSHNQITICLSVILYHEKSKSYYRFARQIVISYYEIFLYQIRLGLAKY